MIQGPPGTGKSQTITNMIADFVARGRRVLFVCQKRAALDVVHARLAGRNLDELCTLVHDSQADKKAFVHGLRDTYESWLTAEQRPGRPDGTTRRGRGAGREPARRPSRAFEDAARRTPAGRRCATI